MSRLRTLKQQFIDDFYRPVERESSLKTKPDKFEVARHRYEDFHGHQLPFGFRTFDRALENKH